MRKYITCLIGILCIAFTSVCFAGRNEITYYSGELVSVSAIYEDGTRYPIPGASGSITLDTNRTGRATVGEGGNLPNGKYTGIEYVFKKKFTAAGRVILDDGTVYGSTGGYGSIGGPVFKKGQTPVRHTWRELAHSPSGDGGDDSFVTEVSKDEVTVTEKVPFTLKENDVNVLTFDITLEYLWFGVPHYWKEFKESEYVKDAAGAGDEDFIRVDSDTISPPFCESPEVIISLNNKQLN